MPSKSQAAIFRECHKALIYLLEVANAIFNNNPDHSRAEYDARFSKVEEIKNRLQKVYYDILDEEDLDTKTEKTYQDNYDAACDAYDRILVRHIEISSKNNNPETLSSARAPNSVLPMIELPKFSSKLEDWPSFITIFKSLTDTSAQLSGAVKLHYLLSCLSGEALSMISHLKITNENYPVALDILTKRYENRRVLIDRFVDIIYDLPTITTRSDIRRLFLTPLVSAQSALLNLKLPMDGCDYVFVSIAVRKLKGELRSLFERKHGSDDTLPTLTDLIDFLTEHARYCETERAGAVNQTPPLSPPISTRPLKQNFSPPRFRPQYQPITPRAQLSPTYSQQMRPTYSAQYTPSATHTPSAQYTNSAQSTSPARNIFYCPWCNIKGHKLMTCTKYYDQPIQGRWDFITAKNRCRRCLAPHYEKECKSMGRCKECGSESHHTSLHRYGDLSPSRSSAHLLPQSLRERSRERPPHHNQPLSAHAARNPRPRGRSSAGPARPLSPTHSQGRSPPTRSPSRSDGQFNKQF